MAGEALRVRLATGDDLPALRALIPRSVRGLSRPHYSDAQIEASIVHVFGPDTQLIADGTYFVVLAGERIVACGGWSRRRTLYGGDQHKGESDPLVDPALEPARIRAFFVDPDFSRRGLGTRLMNACLEAARAAGFSTLELGATLPGVPLYRAFGFRELERVDVPLPGGQVLPIVRMGRALEAG
ncbi:MAG TPA: GNAT family N-acetyltransferase [Myxococcota bacterium]|nr:GNAT family N-acetyltransferase [Myxococcota bacterium]